MARAGVLGFPGLRGFGAGGIAVPTAPLVFDSGYALDAVAFSNSDQTATSTTEGGYEGAYSDPLPSSGKYYIEFSFGRDFGTTGGFGLTQRTTLLATHPTEQVATFVGFRSNGVTGAAGTGYAANTATIAYGSADAVIGIAIDMDTGNFWHRVNSESWSGGDPVAGTGACGTVPSGVSDLKLYFTTNYTLAMTIKALAGYTYATPVGYTALGGA